MVAQAKTRVTFVEYDALPETNLRVELMMEKSSNPAYANTGWSILTQNLLRSFAMTGTSLIAKVCSSRANRLSRRCWAARPSTVDGGMASRNI